MARPTIVADSSIWKVYPTGRITVYGKDEFGLLFELGTGPERKRRFTRYSPLGSKSSDASLAELTERQLPPTGRCHRSCLRFLEAREADIDWQPLVLLSTSTSTSLS